MGEEKKVSTNSLSAERGNDSVDYDVSMKWSGFPGEEMVKNLPANTGDMGSVPGSARSPGEENGHPSQYSCLENPMDRGTWQARVYGVSKELDTT